MNEKQFNLIVAKRLPRVSSKTLAACRDVILNGATAYKAEKDHGCPKGTAGRYVNQIYSEVAFCEEVVHHGE